MSNQSITVALTGASGMAYGLRLLECLLKSDRKINLLVSAPAQIVLNTEMNLQVPTNPESMADFFNQHFSVSDGQLSVYGKNQWMAPIASGSNCADTMVVCPCTSGTLSNIAHGASTQLIDRAADVTLKENKKLILVLREMPLSTIHLENMLKLSKMGVTIMPASPGYYHHPESINDLVDFVVARILDHMNVPHKLMDRWGE